MSTWIEEVKARELADYRAYYPAEQDTAQMQEDIRRLLAEVERLRKELGR